MRICSSDVVNEDGFSYYPQLDRLNKFCQEHYQQDIDLARAADICTLERTYFCTFFREKIGVCFKCWLRLLRVEHAKRLIETKNHPITRIALDVGFNSLSSFERAFKSATGKTPIDYKQLNKPC